MEWRKAAKTAKAEKAAYQRTRYLERKKRKKKEENAVQRKKKKKPRKGGKAA